MRKLSCLLVLALLLVLVIVPSVSGENEPIQLDRPLRITLKVEGRNTPLRGEITSWSFGDFWVQREGKAAPMRVPWLKLQPRKVYETARRLIDRDDAQGYLNLGIEMLILDEATLAQRSFASAKKNDSKTALIASKATELYESGGDPRDATARTEDEPEGAGDSPVQRPSQIDDSQAESGATPWPEMTDEERAAATARLRRFAADTEVSRAGPLEIYETEHYLLVTDLTEREMRLWGGQLEAMYETLLATMSMPRGINLFAGKCVIYIFAQRDAFLQFEEEVMNNPDAGWAAGFCHQRGGDVFVAFYRQANTAEFAGILIHESVHGFMYRYRSPARLPTWANEGLADYVAGHLSTKSIRPMRHWMHAKQFIEIGGDPLRVMKLSYRDGSWPTDEAYPVSHMLVQFLLRYKAPEFKLWIDDIKNGADWETSMKERFGVDAETLAKGFADEIKSEKRYTALP